ncbi:ATP-binding protein [Mycoplasmatota bacterium]|nr:ATP-binding protein [Mycoplasmatota bacterium]
MDNLTSYIFDLCQNSLSNHATSIKINITKKDCYKIKIIDNGSGIKKQDLKYITSPFFTTRTTRRIGLGIPLVILLTEQTQGYYRFRSIKHLGTTLFLVFDHHHLDFPDEGDYGLLIADIIQHQCLNKIKFTYKNNHHKYIYKYNKKTNDQRRISIIDHINTNIKRIEEMHENIRRTKET